MSQAVMNLIAKKALKDVANKEFNAKVCSFGWSILPTVLLKSTLVGHALTL